MKRILTAIWTVALLLGLFGCTARPSGETPSDPAVGQLSQPSSEMQSSSETGETRVVVDGLGREVQIPWPLERAVVANRYNSELIRACGAIDRVIAVDTNTAQDRVYWSRFDPDEVIGKGQSDLNYEQIVNLGAQVLITPKNGTYEQDIQKLEPFGIPVVVITGWDAADLPNQIDAVGRVFGVEERASELRAFYESNLQMLQDCLSGLTERKTVYWEYGDPFTTCIPGTSNDGWHNMILMAGGENIVGDASLAGKDIDPEQILLSDPDLIVKIYAGEVVGNSGIFTAPPQEEFAAKAEEMLQREGWQDLTAVKEGNFYLNTAFMSGGLGKMIGAAYMAKWLYPDLMTDLDPDALFTQWMAYQGFEPNAQHYYHVPAQDAAA